MSARSSRGEIIDLARKELASNGTYMTTAEILVQLSLYTRLDQQSPLGRQGLGASAPSSTPTRNGPSR